MFGNRLCFGLMLLPVVAAGLGVLAQPAEPEPDRSPLGAAPDWSRLAHYDQVWTRDEFVRDLTEIYSIGEAYKLFFDLQDDAVRIKTGPESWETLHFREPDQASKSVPRTWRPRWEILSDQQTFHEEVAAYPLAGLRLVLDPGHLGGRWAVMEERWFKLTGHDRPVTEGDMTLLVARLLKPRLEALGATVFLIRDSDRPTTRKRPVHFLKLARHDLAQMGLDAPRISYAASDLPEARQRTLQWHQEKYFYRVSEIRQRAILVNERYRPDLTLCLHFNAEAWGDPAQPRFVPRNHLHLLVNGAYSLSELGRSDERFEMMMRLLQGMHAEELALAEVMATHLARQTQLPAYNYTTPTVKRPSANPYVYARNLLANRVYACPVIYLEPYVMNCEDCYARIQEGPYEGRRVVAGRERISLFHEYVEGVVQGLPAYYAPRGTDEAPEDAKP